MLRAASLLLAVAVGTVAFSVGMNTLGGLWGSVPVVMAIVIGVVLVIGAAANRKTCPRCTSPMPPLRRPASVRQMLWGGWTCPGCGCEMDRRGREISPAVTPP
jgi:hypothetical protein